jgi:threonine synthase
VPKPYADVLLLQILRESQGLALSVTDAEIIVALQEIARAEGLLVAPEGAALWAALKHLVAEGKVHREERIVLLNTGSGYKYLENIPTAHLQGAVTNKILSPTGGRVKLSAPVGREITRMKDLLAAGESYWRETDRKYRFLLWVPLLCFGVFKILQAAARPEVADVVS